MELTVWLVAVDGFCLGQYYVDAPEAYAVAKELRELGHSASVFTETIWF
jgi:hypothetical protein